MSSRRLLTSIGLHLEQASHRQSTRRTPSIAGLSLRPQRCRQRLISTTPSRRLQEPPPSATTANTSSQDPNKAAAAESVTSPPTSTAAGTDPPPQPKIYTYEDILAHTTSTSPSASRIILIDVREPAELATTGRIPTALNVPITSSPDALFLPETEFEDRFGFPRPGPGDEVVFYCKSGVRSRAAARMAGLAEPRFGGAVGEYPGSWAEWEARGGGVERG